LAHAADGCHHDGHAGEPAGRDGEHVAVEVVAVNDVDAVPAYVVRQPRLLPQRSQIVEALDGVRRHRDAARLEERQEPAGAIEAGEADGEFREIEPVDQVHHLAFRPSLGEDGQELQEINRWHGPISYRAPGGTLRTRGRPSLRRPVPRCNRTESGTPPARRTRRWRRTADSS